MSNLTWIEEQVAGDSLHGFGALTMPFDTQAALERLKAAYWQLYYAVDGVPSSRLTSSMQNEITYYQNKWSTGINTPPAEVWTTAMISEANMDANSMNILAKQINQLVDTPKAGPTTTVTSSTGSSVDPAVQFLLSQPYSMPYTTTGPTYTSPSITSPGIASPYQPNVVMDERQKLPALPYKSLTPPKVGSSWLESLTSLFSTGAKTYAQLQKEQADAQIKMLQTTHPNVRPVVGPPPAFKAADNTWLYVGLGVAALGGLYLLLGKD